MKTLESIENGTIILGSALGLQQIDSILGIALLVFQLILIITKCVIMVVDKMKKGKVKEAIKVIDDTKNELNDFIKNEEKEAK